MDCLHRELIVQRLLSFLLASLLLAAPSWAQDDGPGPDETESTPGEPEAAADAEDADAEEELVIDETGLDEQGFSDEDNDFRPSEDIPADQSIPFPTDI